MGDYYKVSSQISSALLPSCSDIKTFPDIYAKRALILKSSNMGWLEVERNFCAYSNREEKHAKEVQFLYPPQRNQWE